jgi:hypothetical protein
VYGRKIRALYIVGRHPRAILVKCTGGRAPEMDEAWYHCILPLPSSQLKVSRYKELFFSTKAPDVPRRPPMQNMPASITTWLYISLRVFFHPCPGGWSTHCFRVPRRKTALRCGRSVWARPPPQLHSVSAGNHETVVGCSSSRIMLL